MYHQSHNHKMIKRTYQSSATPSKCAVSINRICEDKIQYQMEFTLCTGDNFHYCIKKCTLVQSGGKCCYTLN